MEKPQVFLSVKEKGLQRAMMHAKVMIGDFLSIEQIYLLPFFLHSLLDSSVNRITEEVSSWVLLNEFYFCY